MSKTAPLTKISVVIPAYNAARFLPYTIESALKQTYKNLEVIVVDDGSTDRMKNLPILKDPRVHYFNIGHTGGPAMPRNVGIQAAKGALIAFLDSDDVWLSEKLEREVRFMQTHHFDLIHSNAKVIDEQGKVTGEIYVGKKGAPSGEVFADLYAGNFIINSSVLVKRSCFKKVGYFDPRMGPTVGFEDYDLWLRMAAKFRLGFIAEPLLLYRTRKGSLSDTSEIKGFERELAVLRKNFRLACSLIGAKGKLRPFSLCQTIALDAKGKDFFKYLKYKGLCFRFFPLGTGSFRELWPEAKSVIKL